MTQQSAPGSPNTAHAAHAPYSDWIGKSSERSGSIGLEHSRAVAATLNRSPESMLADQPLPPLWHWCFLGDAVAQSQLAHDGHAQRGEFLPPIELPRRMWAGSRIIFHKPLLIAHEARRLSTIKSILQKKGKSGDLVFITVEHSIFQGNTLCLTEEQDIVYRAPPIGGQEAQTRTAPKSKTESIATPEFSKQLTADTMLLFRYSAVTFNAHRIHYDRDYATQEENYPGLLVHGPLLATMLMELLGNKLDSEKELSEFSFRALAPVYDLTPFTLCGKESGEGFDLWIRDKQENICMLAEAKIK